MCFTDTKWKKKGSARINGKDKVLFETQKSGNQRNNIMIYHKVSISVYTCIWTKVETVTQNILFYVKRTKYLLFKTLTFSPEINTCVSSGNWREYWYSETEDKSVIYSKTIEDYNRDPWGTPQLAFFLADLTQFYNKGTSWVLSER